MPFQPTIEEIKSATVEPVTIEICEEWADLHPVAQGLLIGDNSSAILADLVEASRESKKAQAEIVEIWEDMASVGKLATIRTLLNRQSKKLLGFPLTVKDGKLEAAKTRNKASKGDEASESETSAESNKKSDFLKTCQSFEKKATPEQIKMALSVLANILNTPQ
tara:strand:+ start:658 stop:1149 length:492 start_codon:yes stop_codon:yes gene_type:complete